MKHELDRQTGAQYVLAHKLVTASVSYWLGSETKPSGEVFARLWWEIKRILQLFLLIPLEFTQMNDWFACVH